MRKLCKPQSVSGAQELYDSLQIFVKDLEEDAYSIDDLFVLLSQMKTFLEENHEVV